MVYSAKTYAEKIPINGKYVCERTIRRMAKKGLLPSHTKVHYLERGMILEIQEIPDHLKGFDIMLRPKILPRQSPSEQH